MNIQSNELGKRHAENDFLSMRDTDALPEKDPLSFSFWLHRHTTERIEYHKDNDNTSFSIIKEDLMAYKVGYLNQFRKLYRELFWIE